LRAELTTTLQAQVEGRLRENPHYDYAVRMGQWEAVDIVPLREGESAWGVYEGRPLSLGQGAGAIEPAALDRRTDWAGMFRPLHLEASLA
jgi:hypothetical protein